MKWTPKQQQAVRRALMDGKPQRKIAAELGMSRRAFQNALTRYEATQRPEDYVPVPEVAQMLGRSVSAAEAMLKRSGVRLHWWGRERFCLWGPWLCALLDAELELLDETPQGYATVTELAQYTGRSRSGVQQCITKQRPASVLVRAKSGVGRVPAYRVADLHALTPRPVLWRPAGVLSARELAAELHLHPATISKLRRSGVLKHAHQDVQGTYYYAPRQTAEQLLASGSDRLIRRGKRLLARLEKYAA